jgi:hypothetical protein
MFTHPTDCDPLIFQFLDLDALLATRQRSRASLCRYDPRIAKPTWASVRPSPDSFRMRFSLTSLNSIVFVSNAYSFTAADVRDTSMFVSACCIATHKDIDVLEHIAIRHGIAADDVRMHCNSILCHACGVGDLKLARWLADRFGLTAADARSGYNRCLRDACYGGHLEVAQWLAMRFGLTTTDARDGNGGALMQSCRNGHLTTVQWLVRHFKLSQLDMRGAVRWAIYESPSAINFEALEWLNHVLGAG